MGKETTLVVGGLVLIGGMYFFSQSNYAQTNNALAQSGIVFQSVGKPEITGKLTEPSTQLKIPISLQASNPTGTTLYIDYMYLEFSINGKRLGNISIDANTPEIIAPYTNPILVLQVKNSVQALLGSLVGLIMQWVANPKTPLPKSIELNGKVRYNGIMYPVTQSLPLPNDFFTILTKYL